MIGLWDTSLVHFDLKENETPLYDELFHLYRAHLETFKQEII